MLVAPNSDRGHLYIHQLNSMGGYEEGEARAIFREVIRGLKACHDLGIGARLAFAVCFLLYLVNSTMRVNSRVLTRVPSPQPTAT